MTTKVSFKAKSGSDVSGAFAEPAGAEKAPALVVLQEYWGLNDHIKSLVDRFAKEGFLAVAPDLYHGKVTTDASEAAGLSKGLDTLKAVDEIAGAVAWLKTQGRSNGNVAVTGFCLGGALALATACHVPDIAAAVSFYGIPPEDKVDYSKVTAAVMMHVAERDQWVTTERASHVRDKIEAHGKHVELYVYVANHAFMNDTRPDVYSDYNAQVAWERTIEFLKKKCA